MVTGQSYWCGKAAMILLGCSCITDFPGQQDVLLQAEFFLFHQTAPCKAQVGIKTKLSKSEKAPWKCMGRKNNKNLDTSLGIVIFLTNAFKKPGQHPRKIRRPEDVGQLTSSLQYWLHHSRSNLQFLPLHVVFVPPNQHK